MREDTVLVLTHGLQGPSRIAIAYASIATTAPAAAAAAVRAAKVSLGEHEEVEVSLLLRLEEYVLLHGLGRDEAVNVHLARLSDAVRSILSIQRVSNEDDINWKKSARKMFGSEGEISEGEILLLQIRMSMID